MVKASSRVTNCETEGGVGNSDRRRAWSQDVGR